MGLKLMCILGLFERFTPEECNQWITHVQAFQTLSGLSAGYFEDRALLRHLDNWWKKDWPVHRAETRQACTALMSVGAWPKIAAPRIAQTPEEVNNYLQVLNWDNPWAAGSQMSHLVVFLHLNATRFGQMKAQDKLIPLILEAVNLLQDPQTGCWGAKDASPSQRVNGSMKVITAFSFLKKPFPYADRLIDYTLSQSNTSDGCHNVDLIYVLHSCSKITQHRQEEIRRFAADRIESIRPFRKADGGFSFFMQGTGTTYYGVQVAQGKHVSDIHGTYLFSWTLSMLADILGWREQLGWNLPVT
jgi:hypothetical protein